MKNASQIMYKIGKIINIILIPLSALLVIIGIVGVVLGAIGSAVAEEGASASLAAFAAASGAYIGLGIFLLVFSIVSLIVCSKKWANIEAGSDEVADRVFLIVFGVLSDNIFYILCGIFSLVARSQESNGSTAKVEDKKDDQAE